MADQTLAQPFDDPKLAAGALSIGGKLVRAEPTSNGRLTFLISGVPADFHMQVLNDEVTVRLRGYVEALEQLLRLISAHQRGRR